MSQKKEEKEKIEWDKVRIITFLVLIVVILILGYGLKTKFLASNSQPPVNSLAKSSVKGASTQNLPFSDLKKNVQNQINSLKTEAQSINVVDIATSSPQVQKVINDLKAIQDYPKNQLRQTCEKICSGL